jgi:glycosyltransferase involved in cell wall biosynthesis
VNDRLRISIVIPMFNAEAFVAQTIESVLAQTFSDWELVLVDDGSTDGSLAVAERYAQADRRIRIVRQPNAGVSAARNAGYAACGSSEFVIFLDNDDVWEPDALETLLRLLEAAPEAVGAHGLARCIDAQGLPAENDDLEAQLRKRRLALAGLRAVRVANEAPTTFAALAIFNCIVTPGALLIRRRTLDKIGGFDPATVPCDDWDLSLRLSRHGDIRFTDRSVINWRRHETAQSGNSTNWRRSYEFVRCKLILSTENTVEQRRIAHFSYLYIYLQGTRDFLLDLLKLHLSEGLRGGVRTGRGLLRYLRVALLAKAPRQERP